MAEKLRLEEMATRVRRSPRLRLHELELTSALVTDEREEAAEVRRCSPLVACCSLETDPPRAG